MQCSVTCGQGKATRQVVCLNYSDQVVDRSECDPDDLPATDQDCSVSSCQNIHDYGRPIHPFPYPEHQPKSHPGGNPNQNTGPAHIPGDNQWRIGPWGAVSVNLFTSGQTMTLVFLFPLHRCATRYHFTPLHSLPI